MKTFDILKYSLGLLIAGLSAMTIQAQNDLPFVNMYDANIFSSTALNGTARFMGVGGAMGAVGGDASTLTTNPAGIGIYRSSEITLSVNGNWNNTTLGGTTSTVGDFNLQNVNYTGTWKFDRKSGLLNFNIAVGFNRVKNFNRSGVYNGSSSSSITQVMANLASGQSSSALSADNAYDNVNLGWLPILAHTSGAIWVNDSVSNTYIGYPSMQNLTTRNSIWYRESGYINEFNFALGGNISNIFYFGMSFVCNVLNYTQYLQYGETWSDNSTLSDYSRYTATGTGFTYKVGMIVRPINWLRIGAAYHTPTWYSINTTTAGRMQTYTAIDDITAVNSVSSTNSRTYMSGPMKAVGSLGFVIGRYCFIDVDYIYENYRGIDIKNNQHVKNLIMESEISTYMRDRHTVRLGVEIKPIDALALRLGGGYTWASMNSDASRLYFNNDINTSLAYYNDKGSYNVTCGIGYYVGRHAIDLAYVWQVYNADYYSYGNYSTNPVSDLEVTPLSMRSVHNQFVLTYSIRF